VKEIGSGLWQVEQGDSDTMDRLQAHVEEMVKAERVRLNEVRGHEWWADATFFLHDMITFTGIIREHYEAPDLADAIIDTVMTTVVEMLRRVLGSEEKANEAYSNLLFDAKALDDIARARVHNDPDLPNEVAHALRGNERGSNEGPKH
jgi:hypothetical protein